MEIMMLGGEHRFWRLHALAFPSILLLVGTFCMGVILWNSHGYHSPSVPFCSSVKVTKNIDNRKHSSLTRMELLPLSSLSFVFCYILFPRLIICLLWTLSKQHSTTASHILSLAQCPVLHLSSDCIPEKQSKDFLTFLQDSGVPLNFPGKWSYASQQLRKPLSANRSFALKVNFSYWIQRTDANQRNTCQRHKEWRKDPVGSIKCTR